jgi:osmoprotectant transport system ATP-binding protein
MRQNSAPGTLGGLRWSRSAKALSIEINTKIMTNPEFAIEFRDVSYQIRGAHNGKNDIPVRNIVSNISLTVSHSETLVLLGRSGSGKTTLLKLANRMLAPSQGEVFVEGRPTTDSDPIQLRRGIGYVIQDAGLFPHFTVAENIALVPSLQKWDRSRIAVRVGELLSLVGLDPSEFADRRPRELSGGQRQRVGVARALAADPPILLMDEPFGALDPVTRSELQREFSSLASRLKKTIVFVTHDIREALLLGSRIALLEAGRLVAVAPPQAFLTHTHPEVQAFTNCLDEHKGATQ